MERMCINQRYIHSLHLFRVFASAQSQGRECAVTPAHTLFALVSTQR